MDNIKIKFNNPDIKNRSYNRLKKWFIQLNIYLTFKIVLLKYETLFTLILLGKHTKKEFKSNLKKYLYKNKDLK